MNPPVRPPPVAVHEFRALAGRVAVVEVSQVTERSRLAGYGEKIEAVDSKVDALSGKLDLMIENHRAGALRAGGVAGGVGAMVYLIEHLIKALGSG